MRNGIEIVNPCAPNTLITQACVEFQDKNRQKKPCSFRNVLQTKSMGTQISMNEEVPELLLLEREVDSVISGVEIEVSKYELAADLAISDSDSDLNFDDNICDAGNDFNSVKDFCCSSSCFHYQCSFVLYFVPFYLKDYP